MARISTIKTLVVFILSLISFTGLSQKKYGGLALYTVRDEMKSDPKAVLAKVADIGYEYIEAAGYENGKFYGMSPREFKNYLDEVGLKPMSSHQGTVTLENADQMIADVKAVGFKYFVIPVPPMGYFNYDATAQTMGMTCTAEELAAILNELGQKCTNAGLKLLYHNHDFEFKKDEEGNSIIDYLLDNTDPQYVNFQMDLFWVTKAGVDPISYFERNPGRFIGWHVKDMDRAGQFAPVGNGTIDFTRILEGKSTSGMEFYLAEQDMTYEMSPIKAIRISHKGLKRMGFQ